MNCEFGLYIHIPFCAGKCPYCDFYSVDFDGDLADKYTSVLINQMKARVFEGHKISTVYFGGGTPSLMGSERIARILDVVSDHFNLSPSAEITLELNPCTASMNLMRSLAVAGINRLSIGMQSGSDDELRILGRKHTSGQTQAVTLMARQAGIDNISLDWMIGIPGQTEQALEKTLRMIEECGPEHVSAYLLKIERSTPFGKNTPKNIPDDETTAGIYMSACESLEKIGLIQYEISNFAKGGFKSRHNLNYWNCGEYLGIGPAAHSFMGGRRFFFTPSLDDFLSNPQIKDDGEGGGREEYAMLRLRLNEGLREDEWQERYGERIPEEYRGRAALLAPHGLTEADEAGIRLTRKGFLLSNEIITRIIS